ncbi:hypothetical protein Daus18300_008777 [Diaporthe australafricana]|uniref:Cell surface protein n=1 Tax=Diaporthe australafricana TaxID=127596 RepID=A0ABR3WGY1_9PEZI
MGLGSKIKDALSSDHHDKASSSEVKPPGAFPSDDVPQRHADGKDYIAPHGSLIDKNRNTTGHTAGANTGTTGTTSSGLGSTHVGADSLGSSGTQRNKLHKEGDYLPSETGQTTTHGTRGHQTIDSGVGLGQTSGREHNKEGAYWGDLSPGHTSNLNKGSPDRGQEYTTSGTGHNVSSLPDRTTHGHGLGHDHTTGSAAHQNPLHGEPVGGGVYNTVSGAGSPDYERSHGSGKPHGTVHDALTSGTRGTAVPSGNNAYDNKTSLGGLGAPTSRDDRTGPGLAGAGAVGAGYGADEFAHRGGNTHHQQGDIRGTGVSGHGGDHAGVGASEHGLSQGGLSQGGLSHGGLSQGGLTGGGLGGNGLSGSGVGRSPGYGDNNLTHHDQSTSHGHGHAGAGLAGAGVGAAAGYGANELSHRGQGSPSHSGSHDPALSQHTPGVPRSSMLDVEQPSGGITGSHPGHTTQSTGIPHNTSLGSDRGVSGSHSGLANPGHGVPHSSSSPTNVGSGIGTHVGQSSPASSGPGSSHYGPGHPGAKVMHQCQHCGNDNDISHYFKQDVVYRLGQ